MPADFAKNELMRQRRLAKCCESLIGICSGILADGIVAPSEIRFLSLWLADHEEVCKSWPGSLIAERVATVLEDGIITAVEMEHLKQVLSDLVGDRLTETGAIGQSTALPINDAVELLLPGRSFCVTGDFLYGPRSKVNAAIEDRGGIVAKNVSMTLHYLVIGYMSSRDWKFESFGTKIAKAVKYQADGEDIAIISEKHLTSAFR